MLLYIDFSIAFLQLMHKILSTYHERTFGPKTNFTFVLLFDLNVGENSGQIAGKSFHSRLSVSSKATTIEWADLLLGSPNYFL